jgi:hypothetical protein
VKDLDGRSSGRSRLLACREASDSDFSENAQNLNQGRCKRCKQLGYISLLREEYYNEPQSSHLCLQLRRRAKSRLCIDEHCDAKSISRASRFSYCSISFRLCARYLTILSESVYVPQTLRARDFIGAPPEFAATKVTVCEHAASCIRYCPIGIFLYITPPQIATPPSLRDTHFATSGLCSTTCRFLCRLDYAAETDWSTGAISRHSKVNPESREV